MQSFAKAQFNRMMLTASIASVINFLAGIADTVFAGHLFGTEALAGINLIAPLGSLVLFVATCVSFGAAIFRSNAIGACDRRGMDVCCTTGLWAALASGGLLAAMFLFSDAYFDLMGISGAARTIGANYCQGYWAVALVTPLYQLASALVSGDGGHRHSRISLIANIVTKLGLSVPLAHWLGVRGLAWASVAGMAVSTIVLATYLKAPQCTLAFRGRFSWRTFGIGLRYSVQDQLYMLGEMLKMLAVNKFVVVQYGERFLPVVAAFSTVSLLLLLQGVTVNALQPVMGVYLGEKNYRRVREVTKYGFNLTIVLALVASVLLLVFPQAVTSFIALTDPSLIPSAHLAVRIAAAFLVFSFICGYGDSYFLYTGHFALSLMMVCLDSCVMPIALGVSLGLIFSQFGFWLGLAAAPVAIFLIVGGVLFKKYGSPYLLPKGRDGNIFVMDLELTEKEISDASARVMAFLTARNLFTGAAMRTPLIVEEALMIVRERNRDRRIRAEIALDVNDGVLLTMRDDGEIFDITDADADVSSLRAYLVANVMASQENKFNLVTTGVNRNVFRF